MKKLILLILLINIMVFAKAELKDGKYSWFKGNSQAYLTVKRVKENLYHLSGDCYYGLGKNMGELDFKSPLIDGKLVYENKEYKYKFVLTVQKDGSFTVEENGTMFGFNATFHGHFTSCDLPSFSCKKASTFIEKAICNNIEIARLDREMARSFEEYRSDALLLEKNEKRKELEKVIMKEQQKWIKKRNKCEFSKAYKTCLIQSYKNRIKRIDKEYDSLFTQDKESLVKNIRTKYTQTRTNLASYDKRTIEILGESSEGGEATAYYNNEDLKLIEVVWLAETGKKQIEYYFNNEKLIFAFEQDFSYNRPIYWDKEIAKENGDNEVFDPKKTTIKENRYYFNNEELFLWLNHDKKEQNLTIETNSNVGQRLIAHCYKIKNKFNFK